MRFDRYDAKARIQARWIPKNATPIEEPNLGVVYVYPWNANGSKPKYGAVAYEGTAYHQSWHHIFKTDTELDAYIESWFKGLRECKDRVQSRRQASFAGHQLQIGDILTYSWGYDQTNVDWFRVTRTTKNYVWLKPISSQLIPDAGSGPMSGYESIVLDENLKPVDLDEPETKHKAEGLTCYMPHGCASKWTGEQKYSSWYA